MRQFTDFRENHRFSHVKVDLGSRGGLFWKMTSGVQLGSTLDGGVDFTCPWCLTVTCSVLFRSCPKKYRILNTPGDLASTCLSARLCAHSVG